MSSFFAFYPFIYYTFIMDKTKKYARAVLAVFYIFFIIGAARPSYTSRLEKKIFELVNIQRQNNGLKPLKSSVKLSSIAREHSVDMAKRNYTSHITPEGLNPTDRAKKAGFKTEIVYPDRIRKGVGENLAMHQEGVEENGVKSYFLKSVDETAKILVEGWMESPGHRENILNPDYTMVGTGVAVSDDKKVLATQVFF
ncbi:MAG: CAP domain-containing protein [Candidatus Goldiibacteriota bacterium]